MLHNVATKSKQQIVALQLFQSQQPFKHVVSRPFKFIVQKFSMN